MDSLNEVYARRKKLAQNIMSEVGAIFEEDRVGLFVWAKITDKTKSSAEFCDEILYGAKVFITPGHIFGSNGEGYIRISLCSDESTLSAALDRIKSAKNKNQWT